MELVGLGCCSRRGRKTCPARVLKQLTLGIDATPDGTCYVRWREIAKVAAFCAEVALGLHCRAGVKSGSADPLSLRGGWQGADWCFGCAAPERPALSGGKLSRTIDHGGFLHGLEVRDNLFRAPSKVEEFRTALH